MFDHLVDQAQHTATKTARFAALSFVAGLLICVGCGFLTVAAWMLLVALTDAATTAVIIGGAYLGIGCILFALVVFRKSTPERKPVTTVQEQPLAHIIAAFLNGVHAGRHAR